MEGRESGKERGEKETWESIEAPLTSLGKLLDTLMSLPGPLINALRKLSPHSLI